MNFLVVGPWNHGGWAARRRPPGQIDFGSRHAKYFRAKIQAPFFAHYLKDKGGWTCREASTFETGTNTWRTTTAWPPRD